MKKIWNSFVRPFRNNRGIAIITAILALAFMTYLATEVTYDATVEYVVNSQDLKRLKAHYAARAGLEISLLRIKTFQQVQNKLGSNASNYPMVNMIWQFPFQWPLAISDKMGLMSKDEFKEANEESFFDTNFDTQISDEGSKIDLNDLASKSKVLKETSRRLLLNLFNQELENNSAFNSKYRNFRFEELINQMADFISTDKTSLNGGEKTAPYNGTEYEGYPPNRGFRTLSELRILPLMDEELFKFLEPRVTIFGLKGINPNVASKEVLMSLDPGITKEVADKIIERRNSEQLGGPYKSPKDFWDSTQQFGARILGDMNTMPIVTDTLVSFKIKSTGVYSNVRTQIEAIVVDVDRTASRVSEFVKKEGADSQSGGGNNPGGYGTSPAPAPGPAPAPQPTPVPPGPPRILYWFES